MKTMLLIVTLLLLFSCSGSNKMVGTVYVAGNEPFTWVALETADGTVYKISATKELEQRLRGLQWRKVEVEYTKETASPDGRMITVTVVKELNR